MPGKIKIADMTVANEIARQLGGTGRLKAMIGAHKFWGDENKLRFKFGGCGNRFNTCVITLDRGSDTYILEIYRGWLSRKTWEYHMDLKHREEGLSCDMLVRQFEQATGLYLSLGTMGR